MSANVICLDARRPKVYELMFCLFCGSQYPLVHPSNTDPRRYHGPCPGCDETASVPLWRLRIP